MIQPQGIFLIKWALFFLFILICFILQGILKTYLLNDQVDKMNEMEFLDLIKNYDLNQQLEFKYEIEDFTYLK